MTTEEKERAYDEALERVRALRQEAIDKGYAIDYVKDYEAIFPELAESEDERIRKKIIENVRLSGGYTDEEIDEMISWLERQKKQKPAEWSDYKDKVNVPYCSSEPEWSEEDELMMKAVIGILDESDHPKLCHWLKSLRPSWKPSEEQMEALNALNLHGDLSYVGQQNQLISLYQDLKKLM